MEKILLTYILKKESAKVELAKNISSLEYALIGLGCNIFHTDAKLRGLPEGISVLGEPRQEGPISDSLIWPGFRISSLILISR